MLALTKVLFHGLHTVMQLAIWKDNRKFLANVNNIEAVQKEVLKKIISRVDLQSTHYSTLPTWNEFQSSFDCTNYSDWERRVQLQKDGQVQIIDSPLVRYQPTSGSTSRVKTIPYTQLFLDELDSAISPWLSSMYKKHPGVKNGVHYWSLSWIPESKREGEYEDTNDDTQLLSPLKRLIANYSQPVPSGVTGAKTMQDSMFATIAFLAGNNNLSMISVWSPTFAISLLDLLSDSKSQIAQVLGTGEWLSARQSASLKGIKAPLNKRAAKAINAWNGDQSAEFYKKLWPCLALVSSWDTAMSEHWAKELYQRLSFAAFEGKGLWATEGVVTIPVKGEYLLAYQSHYYEFRDADDDKIYTAWQLRKGQRVIPIITSGNGFLRYEMNDLLEVQSFVGSVPGLIFKGRISGVDMVGEKMSPETAGNALSTLTINNTLTPVSIIAYQAGDKPQYIALLEDAECSENTVDKHLSSELQRILSENFHYELACDLWQLQPAICIRSNNAKNIYIAICKEQGMLEGDIKIEAIKHCKSSDVLKALIQQIDSINVCQFYQEIQCA